MVVFIAICDAEYDFALMPFECNAIASKAELTVSPVETSASNSLLSGSSLKCFDSFINLFVSPPIADTTTIISLDFEAFLMISATASILSTEPTEVPPNF